MSFHSIIADLKEHNKDNLVSIWVPSLGKELQFKPLTINQQTEIISSIGFDGVASPLTITRAINQIVMDNCAESSVDFRVYDKYHILVGLRIAALGSNIPNEAGITLSVPKTKELESEYTITEKDISIKCVIPTLNEENKTVTKLITEIRNSKMNETSDLVNILYIGEIIKFVDSVSVGTETVNFKDIQYSDRKEIIRNLPLSINNKIVEYIQGVREVEGCCMVYGEKRLTIDQLFVTK